ncbi:MAG: 2-hydroxyglutaryl-CoA dehydratase [Ruminococcaceae bacterium]|nr:2-hydroxyglutaryl-CoA dehydratase [Oscillospiraceae bacterium]
MIDQNRVEFTREMRDSYTILAPNMLEVHFSMIENLFKSSGYNVVVLRNTDQSVIEEGLKYVHNDTCYPALLTIGQMISALKSGKYDVNKTALMMTQTGGGCRASNYIHLLRKALKNAGLGQVPVISLSIGGMEKNSGFKLTFVMMVKALAALAYGDLLTFLKNQTKPYEVTKGETDLLVRKWTDFFSDEFARNRTLSPFAIKRYMKRIVDSFKEIKTEKREKVKVGIVGEIYVKYSPLANNNLEEFLFEQDCEVNVPGIMGFMMHVVGNGLDDVELYGGSLLNKLKAKFGLRLMSKYENYINTPLKNTKYTPPASYRHLRDLVEPIMGHGCKMGEGWLLTAEMMELCESGYTNIVCAQPFGCLPNHIVGKGMMRIIREYYPDSNIVAVDYDPGATKVNQENRIKLMLSVAREQSTKEKDAVLTAK